MSKVHTRYLKRNQHGFSGVELVLIILVIVLLGAAGWFVYKNQHKRTGTHATETSTTAQSTPKDQEKTEQSSATSPDAATYLTIKEWGVKIKLEDADKLTYVMNGTPNGSSNADSITSYVNLKLNDSVSAPDKCRLLGPTIIQATAATTATKIGNYYYGFEGGYDDCGDATVDTLRSKIATQELVLSAIVPE